MNKNQLRNQINTRNALIAGFSTCLIAYAFLKLGDFSISDFSKLYISQATLDNLEISKRVSLFFRSTMIGCFGIPIIYKIIQVTRKKWNITDKELLTLSIISFIGIFVLFTDIMGIKSTASIKFIFLYSLYSIITLVIERNIKSNYSFLANHPILISSSILITTGILLLLNGRSNFREIGIIGYFISNFTLSVAIQLIQARKKINSKVIFWYLLPLCAIPLFIFGAIEATFFVKLKFHFFLPFKRLFIGFMFISYFIYLILPFNKKLKTKSNYQLTAYYFVPATIISTILFIFYHPYIEQPREIFELANPANAQLKIFKFNEIPFIDFMTSHMFSEQFYGIIFNSIFGFSGTLDFQTYSVLGVILYYLLIYFFLIRIIKSPLYILILLLVFPFISILFNTFLIFTILLLLATLQIIKNQSILNYFILFVTIVFLFIWRLDTGAAGLVALLFYFPIVLYTNKEKFNYSAFFKAIGYITLVGFGILCITLTFKSADYLLNNFQNALHYASANQAHGYTHISSNFKHQFYIIHLLIPLITVGCILFSIHILRTKNHFENRFTKYSLQISIFFFLVYIANYQRGIVRHGFIEDNDTMITSTFYFALVLFILSFINTISNVTRSALFFSFSFLLILLFQYFPINNGTGSIDTLLVNSSIRNIEDYFQKENFKGKVVENPQFAYENYMDIKSFLDNNLSDNKTFMDFSNTPMLYYYCQRNVPSYFCQNLQNTIDDFSQFQHIKTIPTFKVPVVVYSNYPTTWFDRTDEVPNAMRQYLIAEYIYKNYKPYGIINKHSIWISKKSNIKNDGIEKDTLITQPQFYHYKKAGSILYHHYVENEKKVVQKTHSLKPMYSNSSTKDLLLIYNIPEKLNQNEGTFLSIEINKTIDSQEIKLEIVGKNKQVLETIAFTTLANEKNYMVRLSNHYLWHTQKPTSIRFLNLGNTGIPEKVQLYKDLRHGH